jgi:hypothetical protein
MGHLPSSRSSTVDGLSTNGEFAVGVGSLEDGFRPFLWSRTSGMMAILGASRQKGNAQATTVAHSGKLIGGSGASRGWRANSIAVGIDHVDGGKYVWAMDGTSLANSSLVMAVRDVDAYAFGSARRHVLYETSCGHFRYDPDVGSAWDRCLVALDADSRWLPSEVRSLLVAAADIRRRSVESSNSRQRSTQARRMNGTQKVSV